jgi:predicted ATPase
MTLGQILLFRGRYTEALEHFEQGRAHVAPQPDDSRVVRAMVQDSEVTCHALAASTLWLLGHPDEAKRRGHEAIDLARTLGHPFSLAEALVFTAVVDLSSRHVAEAQQHAQEALRIATEQGFPHWEAHAAIYQGWARTMAGDGEAGIAQMHAGQAIWQGIGCELARPWFLALLAEAYGHIGDERTGLRMLDEAFGVVANSGEGHYESELYRLRGELLLQSSPRLHVQQATDHFQRALDISRSQAAQSLELRAVMSLSRVLRNQGEHEAAYQVLSPCYDQFKEGRGTGDLQAAHALLAEVSS